MTIRNPVVSQEVEQHLTARLPGWQHRVRFGRGGGMSVPIPCEVCGKIVFHNLANLEAKVRHPLPWYRARLSRGVAPRTCSQACGAVLRRRRRAVS